LPPLLRGLPCLALPAHDPGVEIDPGAASLVISSCQTDDGHQFKIEAALDVFRDFARQQTTVTKAA
jgi:hypothetical protein